MARICAALGTALGLQVEPRLWGTPHEIELGFAEDLVDVAWVSPALLLMGLDAVVPLVRSVRAGTGYYHSALFVRADAAARSVVGLRGLRAAWVAPTSASGYIFPRLALADHGYDPRSFFGEETFLGSHGAVSRAVLSGEADVGATYATFENGDPTRTLLRAPFLDETEGHATRILFVSPAIPSDLIVANANLPGPLRKKLQQAFERLADDPAARAAVKHVTGAEAFVAFEPGALNTLAAQIETGKTLGLIRI